MTIDPKGRQVSVVFALPIYGNVPGQAMVNLTLAFQHVMAAGANATVHATMQPCVDRSRNELVERALMEEPTHIMWVDSDVVIPPPTVERLIHHNVAVVGGLYHYKVPPFGPVVYDLDPFANKTKLDHMDRAHKVDGMGMGCVLVTADTYRDMGAHFGDRIWYRMSPDEGEDIYFFRRLKEMGIPAFLDPTIHCGHIRQQMITTEDWQTDTKAI